MSLRRIIATRDPDSAVLRTPARPVRRFDRELRRLVADMVDTMRDAPGVGLAAPQVGVDWRVIVVEVPEEDPADTPDALESPQDALPPLRLFAVVNPAITARSAEMVEDQEACLSIPGLFGDVRRHLSIHVTGHDPSGRALDLSLVGFAARVFQHEIDHLDGVLFPDRVDDLAKLYTLRRAEDGSYERVPYTVPA
jgi:peptide deformylase